MRWQHITHPVIKGLFTYYDEIKFPLTPSIKSVKKTYLKISGKNKSKRKLDDAEKKAEEAWEARTMAPHCHLLLSSVKPSASQCRKIFLL